MWQGIQAISDYKPSHSTPAATDVNFLNELNDFYARFERDNRETATKLKSSADHPPITLSSTDVCNALSRISAHKAAGPDNIPGRVLRACAEQLAGVFTDIFNLSLAQAAVPTCFKCTSIVPVPKHSSPKCLNDYRPVALTPIVMKCFERLVLAHLKDSLPSTLDSHQFAYRSNRSTEDAVSMALHSVLTHLDNKNTYARMLFVDFSSAFNTVIPTKRVSSFKFLGTHISADMSWTPNTSCLVKKAHQRLFFLTTLRKNQLSSTILVNFYRCAIESILTNCATVWYGSCSVAERKALQRVVKTAQRITGTPLPAIEHIQRKRCLHRARNILKDSSHPAHRLFSLLPSGRRFRCLRTRTSRLKNSFFPRVVSLLNSNPH
ncbi:hypothetical protein PO909_024925 [Leuciscus waleckii]